jgi:YbbR domain-containing protein
MISLLRLFVKSIPTFLLALALSVAVWISAVSAADPVQQRLYPRPVTIERTDQDPSLVISSEVPNQATVTLSAPSSIWDRMLTERAPIRASIDLSELGPGTHTVPVDIDPMIRPARVVNWTPRTVTITLERLVSQEFNIDLVRRGEPAIGYQADSPTLSETSVVISGPVSKVEQIRSVRVSVDLNQASDNINRSAEVQVLDGGENVVDGLTITPEFVLVSQPISQRGGYRNVVVKVASTGQVAVGYRLTNISVFPPNVTVFSTNPTLVERLPGFVETSPLDLAGVRDDLEVRLPLNLPNGVEVVGDQTVMVQVGVAAIEGSVSLSNVPITIIGLPPEFLSRISPESVDVIISGPIPLLDRLTAEDVRVFIDLSGVGDGTYQFAPRVSVAIAELQVESILPSSIEVVVETRPLATPSPTGSPAQTPTVTPTPP